MEFGADIAAGRVDVLTRISDPVAQAYASVAAVRNDVVLTYAPSRLEPATTREQFDVAPCGMRCSRCVQRSSPGR